MCALNYCFTPQRPLFRLYFAAALLSCESFARRSSESSKSIVRNGGKNKYRCTLKGPHKLEVTFPVNSCKRECMVGIVQDERQFQRQFSAAFTVGMNNGKCTCKVHDIAKVQFPAGRDKESCRSGAREAKEICWQQYMKGLSTSFEPLGDIVETRVNKTMFAESEFSAEVALCGESQCDAKVDCSSSNFPRLSEHLRSDVKRLIWGVFTGRIKVSALKDFASNLVVADQAALAFLNANPSGNNTVSVDEITKLFPVVSRELITEMINRPHSELDPEGKLTEEAFEKLYFGLQPMKLPLAPMKQQDEEVLVDGRKQVQEVFVGDESTLVDFTNQVENVTSSSPSHQLHAIEIKGFPEDRGGYERGFFSGTYFEVLNSKIYERELYWKQDEEYAVALYYCGLEHVWCLITADYLDGARIGAECPAFVKTASPEILDDKFVAFNRIWAGPTRKWEDLEGASVVGIVPIESNEARQPLL